VRARSGKARSVVAPKAEDLQAALIEIAETIDQLITSDVTSRGVISKLYRFAREKTAIPLTLAAAQALADSIKVGDVVFIATGWLDRPHVSLQIGETDGPPGAVVLARALHHAFNVVPFFLIEESLVTIMEAVVQAVGFKILPREEAIKAASSEAPIHAASVLSFPADLNEAAKVSTHLIRQYQPSAVIAIEKGGMDNKGLIYTSRGDDTTAYMAKIDLLMHEAQKSRITTIGIGDGGNEIGMGIIQEGIRKALPFGEIIAPVTETDYLVTASVSNWGAYGIAACLAILLGNPAVFHDEILEQRILHRCADAGLIDGISGYVEEGADGLPAKVHIALVTILAALVKQGLSTLGKEREN